MAKRLNSRRAWTRPIISAPGLAIAASLLLTFAAGCQQLRLPAIDPTGQCLLAPFPTTTTLALPGHSGEACGCMACTRGIGSCIANHKAKVADTLDRFHRGVSNPAFTEPVTPPVCPPPGAAGVLPPCGTAIGAGNPCGEECRLGPPAVLLGDECHTKMKDCLKLPSKGTRGCILLSPQRIVAPVGGEVILMSGVCGTDGYLAMGEPLEWMLTPESVGTFIEVGDDAPGALHRLAKIERTDKVSPSFARGVTSTKKALITRGNLNPNDDVPLDKGQTWLSISSPTEGTSRVTVLAPDSDCWDQRKATATIYWIDARWQFPGPQSVQAGTPVTLSTRVTRSEGAVPARGWTVRYESLNPELALFAPSGSPVIDAKVDDSGNATVELIPVRTPQGNFPSGTATITARVIRPGGESDNMPDLTLGSGQTFVTWSAPQLTIRAAGPAVAPFNAPFEVVANVQNPGDQPATNVRVNVALPPGTSVTQADTFAVRTPNNVTWEIGTIPPRTQLDLFMTVVAQSSVRLPFQARADNGLYAEATVAVDVFRPSLSLQIRPSNSDASEVGVPVTFNIDVTNTGDRPLTGVALRSVGDSGMTHAQTGSRVVGQNRTEGPLQPGQTWTAAATFVPLESGRRCIQVEATADGGQRETGEACATVINRVVAVPAVTATISGRGQMETGETQLFKYRVVNTGQVPLRNVRIVATFDPQLQLVQATEGNDSSQLGQYQIAWTIPLMQPAPHPTSTVLLEGEFRALLTNPRSKMILTVSSAEGARAENAFDFQIVPGPPVTPPPAAGPALPPVLSSPTIPSGPAPIPADPRTPAPSLPPAAAPPSTANAGVGSLSLSLLDRDDPVRIGQPIRYSLSVRNNSREIDGDVGLRFRLPAGVEVARVSQRLAPGAPGFRREGETVYLDTIRDIRPGEAVDYDIELVSNQPQDLELVVEAVSRLVPTITIASQRTRIIP
ncbi:MAG: DUF7507 domain-containing protein [Planctomycetaceae bacterium]